MTTPLHFATLPASALRQEVLVLDEDEGEGVVLAVQVPSRARAAELADLMKIVFDVEQVTAESRRQVLHALLPEERLTLTPALLTQLQMNAQAQAELADEFGLLTSAQVATRAGSTATNTAALASRWRAEERVFGVEVHGSLRYPGFQFDEQGQPVAVIARVLRAWPHAPGWELALWFTGANAWLGDQRPVDVLTSDQDLVVDAAERLAREILP